MLGAVVAGCRAGLGQCVVRAVAGAAVVAGSSLLAAAVCGGRGEVTRDSHQPGYLQMDRYQRTAAQHKCFQVPATRCVTYFTFYIFTYSD